MNKELEEKLAKLNEAVCEVDEKCMSIPCSFCMAKKIVNLVNDFYLTKAKESKLLLTDDELRLIIDPLSTDKCPFFVELLVSYNPDFIIRMFKEISQAQLTRIMPVLDGYKNIILAIRSWICRHSVVNPETDDLYMDYNDEEEKELDNLIMKALNLKDSDEIDDLILKLIHKIEDKRESPEYQRCPVCNGVGFVSGGYFNRPGDAVEWVSATGTDTCKICKGTGIIVKPDSGREEK